MRQPLFVPLLWLCIVGSSHAQDDKPGTILKVNLNYVHFLNQSRFTVGDVAPALVLYDKWKNSHEVELNQVDIRKEEVILSDYRYAPVVVSGQTQYYEHWVQVGGSHSRSTLVRLRYQYSFRFLKARKCSPYLGVSTRFGYEKATWRPYLLEEYKSTMWIGFRRNSTLYNVNIGVVPGIQCRLGKRMFTEVSLPVNFIDLAAHVQRTYNPNLPVRQQRQLLPEGQLYRPTQFHLRAGIGIKI